MSRKGKRESEFDRANREAAVIILADPEKYEGLPTLWAKLWWARHMPGEKEPGPPLGKEKARTQAGEK
jgi:hypothetical protein